MLNNSKNANIKMDDIFKRADKETTTAIWNHLLVILSEIDPSNFQELDLNNIKLIYAVLKEKKELIIDF